MKCIKCDDEAEYVYVLSFPLTGLTFYATGGSLCGKCLGEAKQKEKELLSEWTEFHQKITKG